MEECNWFVATSIWCGRQKCTIANYPESEDFGMKLEVLWDEIGSEKYEFVNRELNFEMTTQKMINREKERASS